MILQKTIKPYLPSATENLHYKTLLGIAGCRIEDLSALYIHIGHRLSNDIAPLYSETYRLFIKNGYYTENSRAVFMIYELRRYLRRVMQLSTVEYKAKIR